MRRRVILLSAASLSASAALFEGLHTEDGPQQHVLGSPSKADAAAAATAKQRLVQGRFLHITDFHPDALYKTHSSTDENNACHRGNGPAGYYGAETSDCDTPFSLVNATFDWIEANLKDKIDFVIWTGDTARHDSDEDAPRSSKQVLGTNKFVAQKFRDLFLDETAEALSVPVIPTLGNNDILPHNIMLPGPNRWLTNYASIWSHFIPEEQRHSFQLGGWFYVEVVPNKLAVVSLNTLYFFDRNAAIDNCVDTSEPGFKQLEWLRVQLKLLRNRGMKAIIMGHVPPARTDSKMLWDESCWQKYTLWLQQYRDVVTAALYGHMNIDHFMLQDTHDVNIQNTASGVHDQGARVSMDDELTAQGANDYLLELRARWSKLPKPTTSVISDPFELSKGKKGGKGKDVLGGRWAERYQLSMVSPSIVPNYFPTLRVIEYNITGLEGSHVSRGPIVRDSEALSLPDFDEWESDSRAAALVEVEKKKQKKKKKGKKGGKGGKTHDPNLVVPDPPSKSVPPGPAYSPQPLTLVGYTQYFANLTHINNDVTTDHAETNGRWRDGKHGGKQPDKSKPPRDFAFEVEYTTFKDKILKMSDLTVSSYIKLAYRMGRQQTKTGLADISEDVSWDGYDDEDEDEDDDHYGLASNEDDGLIEQHGNETVPEQKKKKKKKNKDTKKKKKKQHKNNKVWLHFLKHAFVSTVDDKDLKKLDR